MKRPHTKGHIDERLLAALVATMLMGLVVIYSASSVMAESRHGSHLFFLQRQIMWTLLSLGAIWCICKIDLTKIAVYSAPVLGLLLVALVLVFVMPARNGAHRWIMLGPATFQPSELLKFVMVAYLAFSLSNRDRDITKLRQLLIPYLPLVGISLLLVLLEPDLGTTIVLSITVLGMFFLAGARMKHLATAILPITGLASLLVFGLGYKKARILDWWAAVLDPLQGSYQSKQAALTLGAGGLFGTGLGDGSQKLFFLPYPHTDFIFAAIGEEIGLVGLSVILFLLSYILWRGFKIAASQPDKFGYLLAAGLTLSLFVNIAINIGVVTSLLPVTGLPLPFYSYGGSSLLACACSVGVLLNLSRRVTQ